MVIRRVNSKDESLYAVTSVGSLQRVIVCSRFSELNSFEEECTSFTDSGTDGVIYLRQYIDMYIVHTVISFCCQFAVPVIAGLGDIGLSAPCVRSLFCTYIDCVVPYMVGLVDIQCQTVDTVAAVYARQYSAISACNRQRISVAYHHTVFQP